MFPLALALATLALNTPAHAGYALTAAASKWVNVSETDAYLQTPVCRAYTQVSTSKEPVEFSMSYPVDGKILPMIGLRTKLAPSMIAIKIERNKFEYLFLLKAGATNEEANLYWYAPVGFTALEALVRERNVLDLVLDPKGAAPSAIQVSLAGSSNALDVVKKCLKTTSVPGDFFKLLNAQKDALTPDLGDRSPLFLMQTVQQAFAAYKAGQAINLEIAALRKTVAPILAKESAALAELKNANANFNSAQTKLNTATALVETLTTKLAESKATLASLQAQKPIAEADLAKKKATYLPLKEKLAAYEKAVVDATALVKSTENKIDENENLIARNTKRIPQLESESASLRRQIPGLENEVNRTRRTYDDADTEYRRYDVRRETENILSRDAFYGWAKRDLENAKRELDRAKSDYWPKHTAMFQKKSEMEACQRQQPPVDCSGKVNEFRNAEREWQQASMEQSNWESKVRDYERKVDDIEDEAKRKAERESDDLRRKRDDAESYYNRARNELSSAQDRIAEIRNAIPVLRRQIETARANLVTLREKLAVAQASLAEKISQRDKFAGEIGFEQAKAEYLAADALLKEIVVGIAARTKEIPLLTKQLTDTQKTIPGLTKTFETSKVNLAAAEAKLAPIQEQLKPFRAEEAVKLAALESENVKFKTGRAAYQDLVKLLIQ